MEMQFKIREPKVGMRVVSKKASCCFGMPRGDGGYIISIGADGLSFKVRDWKGDDENHCVQCAQELRQVSKEEWQAMCDAEAAKPRRRNK